MATPAYLFNRTLNPYLTIFTARVLAAFPKTNNVLADIPGLQFDVVRTRSYRLRGELYVDADAVGGLKVDITGSAVLNGIIYQMNFFRNDLLTVQAGKRITVLNSGGISTSGALGYLVTFTGEIDVAVNGSVGLQFAQRGATGISTVLTGSIAAIEDIGSFVSV